MTVFGFQPARGEHAVAAWRALDRALYRWVLAHGGSPLLATVAAWCSLAESLGHTGITLHGAQSGLDWSGLDDAAIAALRTEAMVGDGQRSSAFVLDAHGHFAFWRNHAAERAVAQALAPRLRAGDEDLGTLQIEPLFAGSDREHTAMQRVAVQRALERRLLVLAGGPGTGKTTTVLRILVALASRHAQARIALAAPTGKAAQRLAQAVREGSAALRERLPEHARALLDTLPALAATTLHRLLGYHAASGRFRRGPQRPLAADIVVVDEASMVDLDGLRALLSALRPDSRLILVGDPDQLASVAAGSVLHDLVAALDTAQHPSLVRLSHGFRAVPALARLNLAVRSGEPAALAQAIAAAPEVLAWHAINSRARLDARLDAWSVALAEQARACRGRVGDATTVATSLAALGQRQLLCALREGPFGAEQLQQQLEARVRTRLGLAGGTLWYPGRAVMITRNDYAHGLFNGDLGITLADADGQLRVWFESVTRDGQRSLRAFVPGLLPEHGGAWAITIHRSQGSEYERVAVVLPDAAEHRVLSRQLLYTGVSRAKSALELWAGEAVIAAALARPLARSGGLAAALQPHFE